MVKLIGAQPLVTRGHPEQFYDPVPVLVRRAQLARRQPFIAALPRRHLARHGTHCTAAAAGGRPGCRWPGPGCLAPLRFQGRAQAPVPVVGIATDGAGYLLVTKAGNVYTFNTPFYGSKAGHKLPAPIVGITADPATGGYWLATSAGNVYQFNAPFYGSEAGKSLPGPITGIVADGGGYLLAGTDGSVYNFNTPFYGSKAGQKLPAPAAGITAAG